MIKGTIKLMMASLLMVLPLLAKEGPAMNGHIEATYNYNLNQPKAGLSGWRSYDNKDNTFLLNTVMLRLAGAAMEKLTYTVEADFGTDAMFNSGGSMVDIQEAYINWKFNNKLNLTIGKFVTFMGIEVIEGPVNPTVSRGFLFGLCEPFTHPGAYLQHILSDKIDIKLGVVNGWDLMKDNNDFKTIISRVGLNLGDPLSFGIVYYLGAEGTNDDSTLRHTMDITGVSKIIPKTALNFQFNWGMQDIGADSSGTWMGFGVQPVYTANEKCNVGLRFEMLMDGGIAPGATADASTWNLTVTPGYMIADGLWLRLEGRYDSSDKDLFEDKDGAMTSSQITVGAGFSYMY